jgi:hypothetical protein
MRSTDKMTRGLLVLAVVCAIVAFLVHELYSLDIWWQTAIGHDILETQGVPSTDRYSVAGMGRPYHDSHWLFQVVMAFSDDLGGLVGVQLTMIAIWAATLWLCYRACRRWVGTEISAVLVFMAAMASVERFLERPEIVAFLGLSAFYLLLQERRYRGAAGLTGLGAVQVLWTNSHGLFVLGPFLVGAYWLQALFVRLRGDRAGDLVPLTRALGVVLVASCMAPFGVQGWRYVWLLFHAAGPERPQVFESLGELTGTFGAAFRSSPAFWFFALLLIATGLAVLVNLRHRRITGRLIIVLAMTAIAMTGRRNVVLLALVTAPFVAESLSYMLQVGWSPKRGPVLGAAVLMLVWTAYPLSGAFYLHMEIPARAGLGVTPSFFPHHLPAFLDEIGFQGQVLNSNTLGGFYLYHGYPARLPLTDGRWEIYSPEDLAFIFSGSRGAAGWQQVVARYDIDGVLLAHTSPEARAMIPELAQDPDWRPVYLDKAASFWLSAGAYTAIPAIDRSQPSVLPAAERLEDALLLNAFLDAAGATVLQLANLERALRIGGREAFLLEQLGRLQLESQRLETAEYTFRQLLELEPHNRTALNELAYLAFARGDLDSAASLLRQALERQPGDEELQENLRRVEAAQQGLQGQGERP